MSTIRFGLVGFNMIWLVLVRFGLVFFLLDWLSKVESSFLRAK